MKIQRDGKEYTLTAEEVMEAHEEFVTSFMVLDRHTLELSNEELEEINLYLLNQREHAIALYSQQLYGMKRTANRLSNTSTSFQDQLQHMN